MTPKPIKLTKAQHWFLLDCTEIFGATAQPRNKPMRRLLELGFIRNTGSVNWYKITESGKQHLASL